MNDHANNTGGSRVATPCPIVQIAGELRTIDERRRHVEALGRGSCRTAALYCDGATEDGDDLELALRDLIASRMASSLEGAGVQICEAIARVDQIGVDPSELQLRPIKRLLFSALRCVDDRCERRVADLIGEDMAGWNIDPWTPVEDRLARLQSTDPRTFEVSRANGASS